MKYANWRSVQMYGCTVYLSDSPCNNVYDAKTPKEPKAPKVKPSNEPKAKLPKEVKVKPPRVFKVKLPKEPMICANCGELRICSNDRCRRCAKYFYRHGKERPLTLRVEYTKCKICNEERKIASQGRCSRCSDYFRKHGKERPVDLYRAKETIAVCKICGETKKIHGKGKCKSCASYFYEHGFERNDERATSNLGQYRKSGGRPRRVISCSNCGIQTDQGRTGRCENCASYFRKNGQERPERFWKRHSAENKCKTCCRPLIKIVAPTNGYCRNCYMYIYKYKSDRPQKLWGDGPYGWCKCGQPANHQVDGFSLCDNCAKELQP